jgi:hypothetical protein
MNKRILGIGLLLSAAVVRADVVPTSLWELNGDLDSSIGTAGSLGVTGGWTASYQATDGSAGSEVLVVPAFSSSQWLAAGTEGMAANGGGSYVNNYTILMDVKFDAISGYQSLYQTNTGNSNDGDSFVNGSGGIGISSDYAGSLQADTWYRLAIVNDYSTDGTIEYYINGALVNTAEALGQDGRFSLYSNGTGDVLMFADNDGETGSMKLDNLAFFDSALSASDIADLGDAHEVIPEPATLGLLGIASLLLWVRRSCLIHR